MKPKYLWASFLILMMVTLSQGQEKGVRIIGLSVEGNRMVDGVMIKANSGLRVGQEISGEDIQNAIRNLWKLGLFSDIQIQLEKEVADGVFLVIMVKEYPRLEKIEIKGNKKIKTDELKEAIKMEDGQVLKPWEIKNARRRVRSLYEEKGYLLATVEVKTFDSEKEGLSILQFNIDEGRKVKIASIRFHGNEYYEDKKLKKQLKKTKEDRWWRSGDFKQDEYDEDLENLAAFYKNSGFRDAQILGDSISYTEDKKGMNIDIFLQEGDRYYFGKISWEGNTLFSTEELIRKLEFKEGDVYDQEKFDLTVNENLGNLYYDRGYIAASIIPHEIPTGKDTLNIHFEVIEGNEFKVNKIYIEGNTKTKEKVIRREFTLKPGDTFNVSQLRLSARNVNILNYFSNITPNVMPVSDDKVDLYIKVEEKQTDQVQMSAGYSERDGLIGSVGFTMPNLFGNGQHLSLDWNFGRYYRSFSLSFVEPWLFDRPTLAGFTLFDIWRYGYYYPFDERRQGGSLKLGRRFRWPDPFFRGDWIYRIEQKQYTNIKGEYWKVRLVEGEVIMASGLTQIIRRDSRDSPEFPTRGSVHSLSTEFVGWVLKGNENFHKHVFSAEWYHPLGQLVLYSYTRVGLMEGWTEHPYIPYIERFFMGGSGLQLGEPLRGYDERRVGPRVEGYPAGGNTLLKQTFELRFPISQNPTIFGLLFAEGGNVWTGFESTDPFDLNRSAGLGVRLFLPMVGMIGLDYAHGFDHFDQLGRRKGRWMPHFQFGRGF